MSDDVSVDLVPVPHYWDKDGVCRLKADFLYEVWLWWPNGLRRARFKEAFATGRPIVEVVERMREHDVYARSLDPKWAVGPWCP